MTEMSSCVDSGSPNHIQTKQNSYFLSSFSQESLVPLWGHGQTNDLNKPWKERKKVPTN